MRFLCLEQEIKSETEQVNTEMTKVTSQVDEIVLWITQVTKRLHLVNNDESQLQVIFICLWQTIPHPCKQKLDISRLVLVQPPP